MRKSIIIALVSLLLFSCNLDSSQGVYQKVFNDTATNYEKIQSVLGEIDGELIVYANLDLYAFDGESMERIAKLPKNASYVPFMAVGDSVFFSNRNADGSYTFFSATLDEAAAGIDEGFISSNEVEVTLPSGSSSEIVNFSGLNNFTMDETQVLYTLSSDNAGATHPDELVTHYGFITRSEVSADGFAIKGGAEVHASSSIIGKRIARVYAEDSDMSIGDNVLSDINGFYRLSDDGAVAVFYEFESSRDIDYDNLVIGADSEYFITLEGDLYKTNSGGTFSAARRDFVSDLTYRSNDIMPVYATASGDQIGYLYEEGIYINPASRSGDQLPYLADINDDNDLITAAWIGESGSNVLMATQENGFWIITLDRTDYEASAIHQYDPETDGALSLYL